MATITFGNGVKVNFNGTPTQRDIDEVASQLSIKSEESNDERLDRESAETYRPSFPATTGESALSAGFKTAGNLPSSAISLGRGLATAATHPIETAGGIGSILAGGTSKLIRKAAPDFFSKTPETEQEGAFNAFTQLLKDRYGSTVNLQRTATNDPVGLATDILGLITGGASVGGKTAQLGSAISKVSKPVTKTAGAIGSAIKTGTTGSAKFATSQATGLSPKTISTALSSPEELGSAQKIGLDRATLGENLKNTLDAKLQEFSDLGKAYEPIRTAPVKVTLPEDWFNNVLNSHKLTLADGKVLPTKESTVLSAGDIQQLQHFHDLFAKDSNFTPNSFLNAREFLSKIADYDKLSKHDNLEKIAMDARKELNRYRNQVPNLKKADEAIAPMFEEIKALRSEWIDKKTGELKDSAIMQIANAANESKGGANLSVNNKLKRLEEIQPGITKQIQLIKAIEDIEATGGQKTGTYARAGVGVYGIATLNPAILLAAILSQPSIAIPLLRGLGLTGKKLKPLLDALKKAASDINNFRTPEAVQNYIANAQPGLSIKDVSGGKPSFEGFTDLSTKLLEKLKGRTTVSKQFIEDLTNSPDLKQPERDLIRKMLTDEGDNISVPDFANKVKSELLPLRTYRASIDFDQGTKYENVTLPSGLRGSVNNYDEHIYRSPVKTSAGNNHFGGFTTDGKSLDDYFAHSRVEDINRNLDGTGGTRRVIEIQSDLFQKGRLENSTRIDSASGVMRLNNEELAKGVSKERAKFLKNHNKELQQMLDEDGKLEPYRNTWWERIVREEVKQAAKDGKTKLQFPTGETAMNIEGLVNRADKWVTLDNKLVDGTNIKKGDLITYQTHEGIPHEDRRFLITKNNGDGTFKAVDSLTAENDSGFYDLIEKKGLLDDGRMPTLEELQPHLDDETSKYLDKLSEQLSAKDTIDTNNPIYKFYEKEVGKYLKNKYGAQLITDPQGVKWWEVEVKPEMKKLPIEAFGVGGLLVSDDEE